MLRNGRVCRTNVADLLLLAVFLTLAYVFVQRKGYFQQSQLYFGSPAAVEEHVRHNSALQTVHNASSHKHILTYDKLIDTRIQRLQDFRPQACQDAPFTVVGKVSLILHFFDYQFYDLKMTLGSLLAYTPFEFIEEIIIVDDGSTLQYIKEEAKTYVNAIQLATMYRLPKQTGPAHACMFAANQANGTTLVFLDGNVIVTRGWLEPLLYTLQTQLDVMAIPHFDEIHDPVSYQYKTTSDHLVVSFSWALAMSMRPSLQTLDVTSPLQSAVMRGNVFAVTSHFFRKLGGLDDALKDAAAAALEISFRTWLCGGKLLVVPCSRVGVVHLNDVAKVVNSDSIHRIVQLWLDERKQLVFTNTGITSAASDKITASATERKIKLNEKLKCKDINWYLKTIAKDIYTPSNEAKAYGLLRVKTGVCARVGQDNRIDLGGCDAEAYSQHPHQMVFELDQHGFLKVGEKCLAVQKSAYVVTESCDHDESKHKWEHESSGRLRNVWSAYCAMHVTDPDKSVPRGRQILMVQDCGLDNAGDFVTWSFVVP